MHPVAKALFAGLFTWGMTAAGAALVFFFKKINQHVLDVMLGFASGVMIAASFWSLLAPAIDIGGVFPAVVGFLLGGGFLYLCDRVLPHMHSIPGAKPEGISTSWKRTMLLAFAMTLHNIPEGLAVGVAFGAEGSGGGLAGALAVTLGMGIQNFPEGAAVSIPLRREGVSRLKSFWYGQLSGLVEPVAAVGGAALTLFMQPVLPYALAFAAGAMIFVVAEELIPEAQAGGHGHFATAGLIIGFAVMMALDAALG
ncbi:ZIP family metal transporter [Oscillospiraceae bacterium OttesenSCG-928-F05]|nr:ZIP family metal transporter [Oscillospiraceae bacterium OttesenSCG-928-F05]